MRKDALVFQYQFERGTSFCVSFAGGANFNSYKMDKNAESAKMSHEALTTRINTMCCWTRCSFSEILSPF